MRRYFSFSITVAFFGFSAIASAATNTLHDEFSAMTVDDRGRRISEILSARGLACSSIRREMFQGQLPDGLALWSFSCFAGADHQVAIFPNREVSFFPCAEVAKDPGLVACFAPAKGK